MIEPGSTECQRRLPGSQRGRLLKMLVSGFVLLVCAEVATRMVLAAAGLDPRAFDAGFFLYRPDPFCGYALVPDAEISHLTQRTRNNSLGYRSREIAAEKPRDVFRIAVVGGSAAYGHGLNDGETWPDQLQIVFDRVAPGKVEVLNASVDGYSSLQCLTSFATRLLDFSPDLLLCYLGWNDAKYWGVLGRSQGSVGTGLVERKNDPSPWQQRLHKSSLYLTVGAIREKMSAWLGSAGAGAENSQTAAGGAEPEGEAFAKAVFARNLRGLAALGRANGVVVCFVNELNLLSARMQPGEETKVMWFLPKERLRSVLSEVQATMESVADRERCAFLDLNRVVRPDLSLLSDHVHPTPRGARAIAEAVYRFLVDRGLVRPS